MTDDKIRLSKLMSEKGLCSRREADVWIEKGLVFVNGIRVTELGTKVSPNSRVTLDAQALEEKKELLTILLNKPIGYVSAQPEPGKGYPPAVQLITMKNQFGRELLLDDKKHFKGLAVAGRLDIDSQGLLIFTQDGALAKKIIGEEGRLEKEYIVRVQGSLTRDQLKLLNHGMELDGKKLKPAKVEWLNQDQLRFILIEGKKRQIRRMCEAVGLRVTGLKRVRVGRITLSDLPEGMWRVLGPNERF